MENKCAILAILVSKKRMTSEMINIRSSSFKAHNSKC